MDNQQERLAALQFAGGLATGEGSFCFNIVRNTGVINPVFQLFMTDLETVERLMQIFEANDLPGYFYTRPAKGNSVEQYGIRVHGVKRVLKVAEALLPYLVGMKRKAAEVMIGYCRHRLDVVKGYSDVDIDFVRQMREINGNSKVNRTPIHELPRILRGYMPSPSIA